MPSARAKALVLATTLVSGALVIGWLATRPAARGTTPVPAPTPTRAPAVASSAPSVDAGPAKWRTSAPGDELPKTVAEQRERLFARMQDELGSSATQMTRVRAIFDRTRVLSQGNPEISRHPMTRSECWNRRQRAGLGSAQALEKLAAAERVCGARHMAPLGASAEPGFPPTLCIDQYEFPNLPCEYPVVFVSARNASELCHALGKRLCDAHEWEGACAGAVRPADDEYLWKRPRRIEMEYFKNQDRDKLWAYGSTRDHSKCATGSHKSQQCVGGGWETCGSNTYPTGAFPECVSPFGVFDQHGNAAEHMNLPLEPKQLGSRGGTGMTEMKGSWFIFGREPAHEDDCRWRAPAWHESRVTDPDSHLNYHLGFRCCKDLPGG